MMTTVAKPAPLRGAMLRPDGGSGPATAAPTLSTYPITIYWQTTNTGGRVCAVPHPREVPPMTSGSHLFLRAVLLLVGVGGLAGLLWEPQVEGRNVHTDLATIYIRDPFLAYVYVGSLPFFFGLYQAFTLLGDVGQGQAFSPAAVQALRRIKYCALAVIGFIVGGEAYILFGGVSDDRAGGVAMGVFTGFACVVTATAAAVLERVLQNAVDLQSEHDLTV